MSPNQVSYTPGPWELADGTATIPIKGSGRTVASVRYGPTDHSDACLIAAAPDLLDASKAALFHLDALPHTNKGAYAAAAALRKAIRKAEGRS